MAVNGRVALTLLRNRLKKVRGNLSFWVFVVMLTGVTFFHYCTPQVRSLASYSLTRHATERILFILVIVNATSPCFLDITLSSGCLCGGNCRGFHWLPRGMDAWGQATGCFAAENDQCRHQHVDPILGTGADSERCLG